MQTMRNKHTAASNRLIAAVICLLMLFSLLAPAAAAPADWQRLQIVVKWTDRNGDERQALATPVEGSDGCFWVMVDRDALDSATLQIMHPDHAYDFNPTPDTVLAGIGDAGYSMDGADCVTIYAAEEDDMECFTLYISTVAPEPYGEEPTEEPTPEPDIVPEPAETPIPQGEMINRFGVANKGVNCRAGMSTEEKKRGSLKKGEHVYLLREEINAAGEYWMTVLYKNQISYIKSEFIDVLPQAESDAYMQKLDTPIPYYTQDDLPQSVQDTSGQETETGIPPQNGENDGYDDGQDPAETDLQYGQPAEEETTEPTEEPTAEPTAVPTPAETPIPQGEMINRFGKANKAVKCRTEMSTSVKVLGTLKKGNNIYMLREQTNDAGERWTAVLYKGKIGYIMSEYLDVMSQAESDAYMQQRKNATPVPFFTQEDLDGVMPETAATDAPTSEPTEEPTPEPTEEPTAEPTEAPEMVSDDNPVPPQVIGYGITIGDGAYVRNWPSPMSVIMDNLPPNKVVYVAGQNYVDDVAWHQVQYGENFGYIRADMLRMMSDDEVTAWFNDRNTTPEPIAEVTLQPYDPNSLSSYGYVKSDTVNFREKPDTGSQRIRQLKKFAFCLVLDTVQKSNRTWYRVSYDDKEGYISGQYFKQLTLRELENFLGSAEYLEGIRSNAANNNENTNATGYPGTVISAEDQRVETWVNPDSGLNVSYEPFDPFATPAPLPTEAPNEYLDSLVKDVRNGVISGEEQLGQLLRVHYRDHTDAERLVEEGLVYIRTQAGTSSEQITEEPSVSPTVEIPEFPQEDNTGSGIGGWLIGIAAVLAVGGGAAALYAGQQKKRRAAQLAARKRAAQARQKTDNGNGGNPAAAGRSTATAGRGTATPPASQQAARIRTGTYNGRSRSAATQDPGRPYSGGTSGQRPYDNTVENPYGRYSVRNEENDAYTAAFRPQEKQNDEEPQTNRRRSRRHETPADSDDGI